MQKRHQTILDTASALLEAEGIVAMNTNRLAAESGVPSRRFTIVFRVDAFIGPDTKLVDLGGGDDLHRVSAVASEP